MVKKVTYPLGVSLEVFLYLKIEQAIEQLVVYMLTVAYYLNKSLEKYDVVITGIDIGVKARKHYKQW